MASFRVLLLFALFSTGLCVVHYDFDIGWVMVNPDGQFSRRTIGINGQWPLPTIKVTVGDRVVVNVHNSLGDQPTSLHFHGLHQNGTSFMDGPPGVTQCPIMPGMNFTYDFVVGEHPDDDTENTSTKRNDPNR
jgi:iron transport multicopper oxidase